jgi:hypothetical protein
MRGSTHTMKHTHAPVHVPSLKEVKGWAEKVFTAERGADAALVGTTVALFGWLFYCLARAFQHYQYLM